MTISTVHKCILCVAIFLSLMPGTIFKAHAEVQETYVAFLGRTPPIQPSDSEETKRKKRFDMIHRIALERYIHGLNQVHAGRFKITLLDQYSNESDSQISKTFYKELGDTVSLVFDNTWGAEISEGAAGIRENRVPTISLNADHRAMDFGANAIFIGHDDDTPRFIARFLAEILNADRIVFVAEQSYSTTPIFREEFKNSKISIIDEVRIPNSFPEEKERLLVELGNRLRAIPDVQGVPIVLNVHHNWGDLLVPYMDSLMSPLTLVGADYVTRTGVEQTFGRTSKSKLLIMTGHSKDILSHDIERDLRILSAQYPNEFDKNKVNTPLFLRRCFDAVAVLSSSMDYLAQRGDSGRISRDSLLSHWNRNIAGKSVMMGHELREFDSQLRQRRNWLFMQYGLGVNPTLYHKQLGANSEDVVSSTRFELQHIDVMHIDAQKNSFRARVTYTTVSNSEPARRDPVIKFWNMYKTIGLPEVRRLNIDGFAYKFVTFTGDFLAPFDMRRFPFEQYELGFEIGTRTPMDSALVWFSPYDDWEDKIDLLESDLTQLRSPGLVGYEKTGVPGLQRSRIPELPGRVSYRFILRRHWLGSALRFIAPLILLGFCTLALLLVRDKSLRSLGGAIASFPIGLVAYGIAQPMEIVRAGTITCADLIFGATFGVMFSTALLLVYVNMKYTDHELRNMHLAKCVTLMTILYTVCIAYVALIYGRNSPSLFTLFGSK